MADFDTGDVIRIGCVMSFDVNTDIVNTWHVQIASGGGLAAAAQYGDIQDYCDVLYDYIDDKQTTLVLPKHISVQNLTQDTVWGNIAWGTYAGGVLAQDPTATQVCLHAWGRTSISRVQIRKYLGVFCEPDMTLGIWTAGIRALCHNMMVYHIAPHVMANGSELVGVAYNPTLARATLANSATTSAIPVIQRRRRVGRGS